MGAKKATEMNMARIVYAQAMISNFEKLGYTIYAWDEANGELMPQDLVERIEIEAIKKVKEALNEEYSKKELENVNIFHMDKQNFYIGSSMWIQTTEIIDQNSIAVNVLVDNVKLAGIMNFKQVSTQPSKGDKEYYMEIKFTAIMGDPVDMLKLHDTTGKIAQDYRIISQIMIQAWLNKFFPYPG